VTELDTIKAARKHIKDDPHLAVFMVRDLEATKMAQMTDVCWEITRQGFTTWDEATWVLNKVEAIATALVANYGSETPNAD
jgi:hypothetical protein